MNAFLLLAAALNVMMPPVGVNEQNSPTPEEIIRMAGSGFLTELLSGVDTVRLVDERRTADVLRLVEGGACDYGQEKRLATIRRHVPVDVLFTYRTDKPGEQATEAVLEAETQKGVLTRKCAVDRGGRLTPEFAKTLADLAAEAIGADAATRTRFAALAARRGPVLAAVYVAPRVCARLGGCQAELRFGFVSPSLSKAKEDPAVAFALVDAGDWAQKPRPGVPSDPGFRPQNVIALAKEAVPCALADDNPLAVQWFLKGAWPSVGDKVTALAEGGSRGAVGRMMDEALESSGDEDLMADLAPVPAKKKEPSGCSSEDSVRGAILVLGEMQDAKTVPVLKAVAAAKEASMRLAAAVSLAAYTNTAKTAAILAKLARDADPAVAVAANRARHRRGLVPQPDLAPARKLLDAKSPTALKGYDPEADALLALAEFGGAEDRARFERFADDPCALRRALAVRGLVSKCDAGEVRRFLSDADATVVCAAVKAVPAEALKKDARLFEAIAKLAEDAANAIANEAFARISLCRPKGAAAAQAFDLRYGHPYVRRRILMELAAKGDAASVAAIEGMCAGGHPQTRVRALRHLVKLDAAKAHPHLVKAIGDVHGWVRLHAAAALATRARKEDGEAVKAALAKERDPAIRLYLEDALAKAEGRPAPAPQPAALPIVDRPDAPVWICGYNEAGPERSPFTAYYTCREPTPPTASQKRKHDAGAPAMTRPNPLGNFGDPGTIMTDRTAADYFWTKLRRDFPKEILEVTDAMLLGEESMSFGGGAIWWNGGSRLFCAEAGLDYEEVVVRRANGGMRGLTENQKLAAKDFACRLAVEGFNEIYDFIHLYFGKLRPGMKVATGLRGEHATYLKETTAISPYDPQWKFDIGAAYEYEWDWRYMYAKCRAFRTIWPDRPMMWLSYGNTDYGVGPCYGQKPTNWKTPWPTNAPAYRWDHSYVDNLAVWMAGADPGFYALYSLYPPGIDKYAIGTAGSAEPEPESIFPGSFVVEGGIDKMFSKKTEELLRTEMEGKKKPKAGVELDDDGGDEITLEEQTGANSVLGRRFAAMRKAARNGLLYCEHAMENAARAEIGLPRIDPGRYPTLVAGPSLWIGYTPAAMLTDGFDAQQYLPMITACGGLDRYSLVILGNCQKTPMDEATRLEFLRWLKEKPGVLVVTGMVSDDVPVCNVDHPDGDLRTPWPWKGGIELVPADGKTKRPARYRLAGDGFTVLEKDAHGVARCTWSRSGYKGLVVFELLNSKGATPEGRAAVESMRKLLSDFYAKNGVDFPLREAAGGMSRTVGSLHVEILSDHSTAERELKGCELLTGQWNPKLTPRLNAAMVTEDYVAPFVAVHGGVCVFSEDKRIVVVEKLPNGLKVKIDGLVRVTTKSGRPAKVDGAKLPVFTGDVGDWMLWGKGDGRATLPARNAVQLMDQPDRTDNVPSATILRHMGTLTITAQ